MLPGRSSGMLGAMTTRGQLRKAALSLPETDERAGTFTVCDKQFATIDDDGRVCLHLPAAEMAAVQAECPGAERSARGGGVRVPLGDLDGQRLNHWVRRAWLSRAPKRLAEQAVAAESAVPGAVGDLPKGIGKPATRALTSAGITSLAQVAELGKARLLAMHGVGPKAVRVLGEALDAAGRAFKG